MSNVFRYAIVAISVTGVALAASYFFEKNTSTIRQPHAGNAKQLASSSGKLPSLMRYQEGVHYRVLRKPFKTLKPELREVFSYACPHCNAMQPVIHALQENGINVYENPMPFMPALNPSASKTLAIGLIAAREHKRSSQYSEIIFKQFHQNKKRDFSEADVVLVLTTSLDISSAKAEKLFSSAKQSSFLQADLLVAKDLLITNREIPGVPSFIVDGQYVLNLSALSKDDLVGDIVNVTRFLQEKKNATTAP